jgi:uncharacterized protein (UPF0305 family)
MCRCIYHIIRIRNKQDPYHALTDKETLDKILEQALGYVSYDRDNNTFEDILAILVSYWKAFIRLNSSFLLLRR